MSKGYILIERLSFSEQSILEIEKQSYEDIKQRIMEGLHQCEQEGDMVRVLKAGINLFKKKAELEEGNNLLKSITG